MGKRAEELAGRVEAGAELLATYAEGLSDKEWNARVRDGRTVGVIVHHVASMYPIEIDVARSIAGGKAVEGVTWEAVAEINAKHAVEQAKVGKAEALELLRKNSREAAAAVRKFSDAELDTAAGFSLSFDAPMTRSSWSRITPCGTRGTTWRGSSRRSVASPSRPH